MLISLFFLVWSVRTTINSFYIQFNVLWLPFRSTWVHPRFLVGSCYSIFSFMFCRSLFVLLYFFLLAIVLSVLRYTDFDCPFGIFKPFLQRISSTFCEACFQVNCSLYVVVMSGFHETMWSFWAEKNTCFKIISNLIKTICLFYIEVQCFRFLDTGDVSNAQTLSASPSGG